MRPEWRTEDVISEVDQNSESEFSKVLSRLPEFARQVLNQSQTELGIDVQSNCINAALNFSSLQPRWLSYSPMELLSHLQGSCSQLNQDESARWGDLVVIWLRTGGSWDARSINVHEMNAEDREFPYGLVFEHVMVYLENGMIFHKPDPDPNSRYQIDSLSAAIGPSRTKSGFEITTHRMLDLSLQK